MIEPTRSAGLVPASGPAAGRIVAAPPTPQVGTPQQPRSPDQVSINPTHEQSSSAQEARTRQIVSGLSPSQAVQGPNGTFPGSSTDIGSRGQLNLQASAMGAFRAAMQPVVPQMRPGFQSSNQQGNDPSGRGRNQNPRQSTGLFDALGATTTTPYRWSQSPGIG